MARVCQISHNIVLMTGAWQPFEVFLSHFAEEKSIAELVQDYLKLAFGADLRVFRSSDDGSIATGKDQYPAILRALAESKVYIVLVSKYAASRPWLNFEAGYGKAKGVEFFPVLIRATNSGEVPTPLSQMELRALAQKSVIEEIIEATAKTTGRPIVAQNSNWFVSQLSKREAAMPNRELTLIPFRFKPGPYGESLAFEILYKGPRAIKLVKVWAEVPRALLDPDGRRGVTGHVVSEAVQVDGEPWWRREYLANVAPPQVRESGIGFKPLHPHLPPGDTPMLLRELRFALNPDLEATLLESRIRCQIVAEDGVSDVQEFRLADIEVRTSFRL